MSRTVLLLIVMALAGPGRVTQAADLTLLDTPVKVTATLHARDEGGYAAQIGVHMGPIAQLVSTTLIVGIQLDAERMLRKQVQWRTPYLFVHSSCGAGRALRCEGETIFKLSEATATRLGDVIGTAPAVYIQGHFLDVYDKLDGQLGISHDVTPRFVIVLDDTGRQLAVNGAATWSHNAAAWRERASYLAAVRPDSGTDAESVQYLSALISNAALARYCNKGDELQQLLQVAQSLLTAAQLRTVTDALSKVLPLEPPRTWRKPY